MQNDQENTNLLSEYMMGYFGFNTFLMPNKIHY